jgi:hypothetical protein
MHVRVGTASLSQPGRADGGFYYSELTDHNGDGTFEIDESANDCTPDCAGGGITVTTLLLGAELVVGVGEHLSENRSIAKLVREGRAVVRRAS